MPTLEECRYSHTETVEAVRDFLKFLTKIYLHDDAVVEPPTGGWPSITPKKIKALAKTEAVGKLLREIPYIRCNYEAHIFPHCQWADWAHDLEDGRFDGGVEGLRVCTEMGDQLENIGPEMIGLMYGEWELMGTMMIDTKRGIVYWCDGPGYISDCSPLPMIDDEPYEWAPEHEIEWRSCMRWTVRDYFEVLKIQFLQQYVLPLSPLEVESMRMESPVHHAVMDIFQEHQWPDLERYDKNKCMAAVKKMLEKKYAEDYGYVIASHSYY